MLFVLGFCVALLLVLLFGRTVWAVIGQWSGWRQKQGVPRAILELQAERDSLKAEKAMLAKRVESGANELKMRMAEQMAEVARNRNRVLDLSAGLKSSQAEIENLKSANAALLSQIDALKLQIEDNVRAINDAWHKATEHNKETEREKLVVTELNGEIDLKKQQIANYESEMRALREIVAMFVPTRQGEESAEELKRLAKSPLFASPSGFSESAFVVEPAHAKNGGKGNPFMPVEAAPWPEMESASVTSDGTGLPPSGNAELEHAAMEAEPPDRLAQSVSNVLSLAERVRGLQKGMKT